MGIAGIGGALSSPGSTYDFTSMTNQQMYDAAELLASEGRISQTDEGQMAAMADGVDWIPINRADVQSTQQILSDPTQHNFLAEMEDIDWSVNNLPGSVGAASVDFALQAMETYQGTPVEQPDQSLSVQA